jgi:hypothetical protein
MVTLLNITVFGLHSRFGATTASRDVKPSLLLTRQLAERGFGSAAARAHDQVDVRDFVAVTDQGLAYQQMAR